MFNRFAKTGALALAAIFGLTASEALADTAYNDSFFRYDINMRTAEVQMTGASTFASLGSLPDVCKSLYQAIDAWQNAGTWLEKAGAAPSAAEDENRLSASDITAKRSEIDEKIADTQVIIDGNCQDYPKP